MAAKSSRDDAMAVIVDILVLLTPTIFCILLAMGLYRWKWGVAVLFMISTALALFAIVSFWGYWSGRAAAEKYTGKPFAEGNIHFSKDNLISEVPVDHAFLHNADRILGPHALVGIRFTPSDGTFPRETRRKWNLSWIYSEGNVTDGDESSAVVELDPEKLPSGLHQIPWREDHQSIGNLRIAETDPEANYSGKLIIFFIGREMEPLRQQLITGACIYILFLALIFGVGGSSGLIKKRWLEKDTV